MSKTIYIGGRLESKEKGNVVTGANAILDDTKGKKQNVINKETDDELLRLEQSKQDNLNFDNAPTENSTNPVTSGGVYTAEKALSDAIEAILLLIPSAATALNKLVDTNTMNSSISTATATFRGTYNAVSDLGLTYQATHAQIEAALDALGLTADNNDFVFVQIPVSDESQDIAKTERFKFNGTNWLYEYDLNTSGFTAAQWAAINSTITLALVQKLAALPTNAELLQALGLKQDVLTFDDAPTTDSNNPVKSGGIKNAIDTAVGNEAIARDNADTALSGLIGDEKTRAEGVEGGLDTRLGAVEGSVSTIQGVIPSEATSSNKLVDNLLMTTYIGTIIDNIDATFNITSTDGHITLAITQVNGVITSVQLITSDIASAAALNLKASQADLTALAGRVTTAEGNITSLTGRVSTNETDIANLQQLYNNLQQSKPVPVTELPSTGQQQGVIYRLAGTTSYSDYMWNGTAFVLMATYNNAIDTTPKKDSANLITSGGVFANIGAFDISEYHKSGSILATYADLTAALAALPSDFQKGGMSVKFVQSSDNKYVQYRLNAQSFSSNTDDWELDVTSKNLIYNPQEYTNTQKETARTNIGLSNIEPKSSTGEESLKVTTDESKELVHIHKTTQPQENITIKDNNNNVVLSVDKEGLHAKTIFYGTNDTNLEEKINEISGNDKDVVLILFMGQSNMAGRGITNSQHPQDAPVVIEGAGYEFRAISDPTKLYPITKTFGNTEDNPNGIDDNGRKTGGPVPSFVNAFYKVARTTIIGVSASEGGESIVNFQPNTSRYNDAVSRFHAAETYLTNNNYNILARYVVWCQGEKNGDTGMSETDYISYFNTMSSALFTEGIEKMMVIRIGEYNGSEEISYSNIINAQTSLCKNNDNYIMVTTVLASLKAKGLMKDDFHYYQEGYNIEGTLSGLHTANYYLFGKSDVMYDVMTNALYFDSKSY